MTRIELASGVADDVDRIFDHLVSHNVEEPDARITEIIQAISALQFNPLLGRPVQGDKRELVIGRKSKGYVALYRYIAEIDTVFVLALRSQREAGYRN